MGRQRGTSRGYAERRTKVKGDNSPWHKQAPAFHLGRPPQPKESFWLERAQEGFSAAARAHFERFWR